MSADAMAGIWRVSVVIPYGQLTGATWAETLSNLATIDDLIEPVLEQNLADCGAPYAQVHFRHYKEWMDYTSNKAVAERLTIHHSETDIVVPDCVWSVLYAHGVWVARWGGTATSRDDEPLRLIASLVGHYFQPWVKETWCKVDGKPWQRPRIASASEVDLQSAWLEEHKITPEQWMRKVQEDDDRRPRLL